MLESIPSQRCRELHYHLPRSDADGGERGELETEGDREKRAVKGIHRGQADGQAGRQTGRQADRRTGRQAGRQKDRQADRQADKQTGRQADGQAGRQAERQAGTFAYILNGR